VNNINYRQIKNKIIEGSFSLENQKLPHEVFLKLIKSYKNKFLFESKDISNVYGRLSLIGIDPVLKIYGKDNKVFVKVLNQRGFFYFNDIKKDFISLCDSYKEKENEIFGIINKEFLSFEESKRTKQKNISKIIRLFLIKFKIGKKSLLGLYGAFSYDFIRLFEDLPKISKDIAVNDFTLFLYDSFVFFDHLKDKSEIIVFRNTKKQIQESIKSLQNKLLVNKKIETSYKISDSHFLLTEEEFKKMVELAKKYTREGEIFEVVFSNILKAKFQGDVFALYLKYREANPSPYLFYFDFGDEELVGASPEMMVRVENNIVNLRPISGTVKRGSDPIEDHENMLALLLDSKEKAELDMLIDLGRNDLSRICKANIKISDYRFVEKYSCVMHTVAHLSGELKEEFIALDALIACLNAGTLTGAPKVAAMTIIEKHEKERRGYYGGAIGYLTFSGDMDTGIIIRTAHIKNNLLRFQVGATLLFKSDAKKEYEETMSKARAFLSILN
jgi:anthranilate synthase